MKKGGTTEKIMEMKGVTKSFS